MTVPTDERTAETSGKATILITPPGTGGDAFVRAVLGDRAADDPQALALGRSIAGTDGAVFCFDRARALLADRPPAPALWHPWIGDPVRQDPVIVARRLRRVCGRARVVILTADPIDAVARVAARSGERVTERWVRTALRHDDYWGRAPDWVLRGARFGSLVCAYSELFGWDRVASIDIDDAGAGAAQSLAAAWLGCDTDRIAVGLADAARRDSGRGGRNGNAALLPGARRMLETYYASDIALLASVRLGGGPSGGGAA